MSAEPPRPIIDAKDEIVRADRDFDTIMCREDYDACEGEYDSTDGLRIHLCVSGGGRLLRKSRTQMLDGLFVPGRVGLGAPFDGGEGFIPAMRLIALEISQRRLTRLVTELPAGGLDMEALASTYHDDALLTATLTAMWDHCGLHGFATAFFDHALAIVIHQLGQPSRPRVRIEARGLSTRQISDVIAFIEADLSTDLRVADLARIAGLSPYHFSRCFQITTGLPPYAFITRRRLDRAAELLLDSRIPVASIATLVGYSDPSQFAAAFKRYKSVSPLMWRRTQ
ncbi:helix-turn-helix domain-containing protein [Methylobacterium sp. Leaf118]|uniref:helix-turn-helix domain-containing protein n=1 Tax=Methylobacterium sp. Leaf118 TaxID=2876562 RepID=UPI001E37E8EA|nr:AraC family transcriptional regulator [Methylobacterium sp. Leaf118]